MSVRYYPMSANTDCGWALAIANTLLAALTNETVSNDALGFLRAREMRIGPAVARVMRISFTGELGYEMYLPEEHQVAVFDAIRAAGEPISLALIGGRALGSLRIEKGYGSWGSEYGPEYTPFENGLDRLIRFEKDDFVGRDAVDELDAFAVWEVFRVGDVVPLLEPFHVAVGSVVERQKPVAQAHLVLRRVGGEGQDRGDLRLPAEAADA